MDRRTALRYLGVASAAAFVLPGCVADSKKVSVALQNLKISADDEELLAQMAAVTIPKTDTPGAFEVGAHLFALVMVDDCTPKEEQEKYLRGMRVFVDEAKAITGENLLRASAEKKTDILRAVDEQKDKLSDDAGTFYKLTRRYIIQGYTGSQHFLTNVKPYVHIPGPIFNGCLPLSDVKPV